MLRACIAETSNPPLGWTGTSESAWPHHWLAPIGISPHASRPDNAILGIFCQPLKPIPEPDARQCRQSRCAVILDGRHEAAGGKKRG